MGCRFWLRKRVYCRRCAHSGAFVCILAAVRLLSFGRALIGCMSVFAVLMFSSSITLNWLMCFYELVSPHRRYDLYTTQMLAIHSIQWNRRETFAAAFASDTIFLPLVRVCGFFVFTNSFTRRLLFRLALVRFGFCGNPKDLRWLSKTRITLYFRVYITDDCDLLTYESTSYRSFCSHFTLSPMRFSSFSGWLFNWISHVPSFMPMRLLSFV